MKRPMINVRGTNGSGKSYVVKNWLENKHGVPYPRRPNLFGGDTLTTIPEYYKLNDNGIILGAYTQTCGGTDRMDSLDSARELALKLWRTKPAYVLFEGVIASSVFESWLPFSKTVGGMHWVFIDTPIEICLERIYARNKGKKINEKFVVDKHRSVLSILNKAKEVGEAVTVLHWKTAVEDFAAFMKQTLGQTV